MTKKIYTTLYFLSIIYLTLSCNQKSKANLSTYRLLNENLELSNEHIIANTNIMIQTFRSYSNDPLVNSKSNILLENMLMVSTLSDRANNYVKSLKISLEKHITADKKEFDSLGTKKVFSYFEDNRGSELYKVLVNYQNDIWQVNPELFDSFKNKKYFFNSSINSNEFSDSLFTHTYFNNIPLDAAIAMLTKFQNDICNYEFRAIRFFYTKLAFHRPVLINK